MAGTVPPRLLLLVQLTRPCRTPRNVPALPDVLLLPLGVLPDLFDLSEKLSDVLLEIFHQLDQRFGRFDKMFTKALQHVFLCGGQTIH
jgi:hypothetical protein